MSILDLGGLAEAYASEAVHDLLMVEFEEAIEQGELDEPKPVSEAA